MRHGSGRCVWVIAGALLIAAAAVSADDASGSIAPDGRDRSPAPTAEMGAGPAPGEWGTAVASVKTVAAAAFTPVDSTVAYARASVQSGLLRYSSSGAGSFEASLDMPAGALFTGIEVDGCDSSVTDTLDIVIRRFPKSYAGFAEILVQSYTGMTEAPGCNAYYKTITYQHTVNNAENAYTLEVYTGGGTSATSFKAARVYYRLQVSPAPVTATFADVPTSHPFFRFVEALAASGITAGCGGGNFCPDDALTRGQMAVYLSAALGLHWAP